jgi:hypothetical protein
MQWSGSVRFRWLAWRNTQRGAPFCRSGGRSDAVGTDDPRRTQRADEADGADGATSTIASISTATLSGSALVPTAERACMPLGPNTDANVSDAPLMTPGCAVKPSTQLTKPVSLTMRVMWSSSPPSSSARPQERSVRSDQQGYGSNNGMKTTHS